MKSDFENWFFKRFPNHSNSILEASLRNILEEAFDYGSGKRQDQQYRKSVKILIEMDEKNSTPLDGGSVMDFLKKHSQAIDEGQFL